MRYKAVNDTLIIKPDPYEVWTDNPRTKEAIESGTIVAPERNTLQKRSPFATVIDAGEDCKYEWHEGDRILIERWIEEGDRCLFWDNGEKYRFIKEHYIHARVVH